MPTRLLIADDHQLFREGLKALLPPAEFEVVAEAADGQEAIRLGRRVQPDLALLDITMPGLNGVDAARELLRVSPGSRVVVLTMHKDNAYLVEALRAGVRGYVLKSQPTAELLHALREVVRGEVYLAPGFWRGLVESYQSGEALVANPLPPPEREVQHRATAVEETVMQGADRGIERLAVQVAPWACGRDSSQDDAERTRAIRGGVWRPGRAGDAGPGSVESRASLPRAVWRAVVHGS